MSKLTQMNTLSGVHSTKPMLKKAGYIREGIYLHKLRVE